MILLWGEDLDYMHGIEVFTSGNISFNWQMQQSIFFVVVDHKTTIYIVIESIETTRVIIYAY